MSRLGLVVSWLRDLFLWRRPCPYCEGIGYLSDGTVCLLCSGRRRLD